MTMKAISLGLLLLLAAPVAFAQVDEAKQAIDRGEYVRAVNILSALLEDRPTADTYLYLGIAYVHMKEYQKAEDVLNEGSRRYPQDARFHNELANSFFEDNDADTAKSGVGAVPQPASLNVPIRVCQLKAPFEARNSFVYQNVQSSDGSTLMFE